ncbi:MAG: TlpA family protein disulfide reductase [Paenibacillus sp.]|jgi:thiol-disulfide isomerase/thioredoxin|nr:TlpA family protein disulfide reductase [Paenibacillus sp.]
MEKIKKVATFILLILIVCVALVAVKDNLSNTNGVVSEIILKDLKGSTHTIGPNKKSSVLVFFTSWCPYCNEDAPKIVDMYGKYQNNIDIYGINLINRDDVSEVRDYVSEYNIEYPILLDEGGSLYKSYGSPGFPTLVFLDKNGKETKRIVGSTELDTIEKQFIRAIK